MNEEVNPRELMFWSMAPGATLALFGVLTVPFTDAFTGFIPMGVALAVILAGAARGATKGENS